MPDWNALREWTERHAGLTLRARQIDQLSAFLDLLLFWNRKLALVSQTSPDVILAKHVADSLFVAARCTGVGNIADLGSGGGFPAIPIAIAAPTARVCLIESRAKKVSFLTEARRVAAVPNALIVQGRIETASADPTHQDHYDIVTARALTGLQEFLVLAEPFLAPTGRAVAMRAAAETVPPDLADAEEISYVLPDGTPRKLVIAGRSNAGRRAPGAPI